MKSSSLRQMMKFILTGVFVSINFFMMGILESSLFTILPRYIGEYYANSTASSSNNQTIPNSTEKCFIQSPHYVIVSFVFLSKNLAMLLTNLLYGYLMERFNTYVVTGVTQCLGICVVCFYAFGNSLSHFIVGRLFDAFVSTGLFVGIFAIISRYFSNFNVRGRYYGLCNTMFFVSISLGPIYGAKLDERFGKFIVFILMIPMWGICMLCTVLLYWYVEKRKPNPALIIDIDPDQSSVAKEDLNQEYKEPEEPLDTHETLLPFSKNTLETEGKDLQHGISKDEKESTDFLKKDSIIRKVLIMIIDPYVAACLIEIYVINFSMYSLPTTLPSWMAFELCSSEVQQGLVWTFGFIGYLIGVLAVVIISRYAPAIKIFSPMVAKVIVGLLLIGLPFSRDWRLIFIPIMGMYVSLGVVEQIIFPMTTHLADVRHHSNYGTMSSLLAQSLTFCGVSSTLISGPIAQQFGFRYLSIGIGVVNLLTSPLSLIHRRKNFK